MRCAHTHSRECHARLSSLSWEIFAFFLWFSDLLFDWCPMDRHRLFVSGWDARIAPPRGHWPVNQTNKYMQCDDNRSRTNSLLFINFIEKHDTFFVVFSMRIKFWFFVIFLFVEKLSERWRKKVVGIKTVYGLQCDKPGTDRAERMKRDWVDDAATAVADGAKTCRSMHDLMITNQAASQHEKGHAGHHWDDGRNGVP